MSLATADAMVSSTHIDPSAIGTLLQSWEKGLRTLSMYLPNNPVRQQTIEVIRDGLSELWPQLPNLGLTVSEAGLQWEADVVLPVGDKSESFAWTLFRDGVRWISFSAGAEVEIEAFLLLVQKARTLTDEDADDLCTLLWSADFQFIRYKVAELAPGGGEPMEDSTDAAPAPRAPAEEVLESVREELAEVGDELVDGAGEGLEDGGGDSPSGAPAPKVVDLAEFESTLYSLDNRELSYLKGEVRREYAQNLNENVVSILFDIFEEQPEPEVRAEIISILGDLLPNLLSSGDFHSVAHLIAEAQVVRRAKDILPAHRQLMDGLSRTLSRPEAVGQLLEALDLATIEPSPDAVEELLGQLRPAALTPLLKWHKRLTNQDARQLLDGAIARMAQSRPASVGAALESSDRAVVLEALRLVAELGIRGVEDRLVSLRGHDDVNVRAALVPALVAAPTADTMSVLVGFIEDPDPDVRIASVSALVLKRFKAAVNPLEEVTLGKEIRSRDLSERRAFFEAYGALAGDSCVPKLTEILFRTGFWRPVDAETRACAAMGLGNVQSQASRSALQRATTDREALVRTAAMRALRMEAT